MPRGGDYGGRRPLKDKDGGNPRDPFNCRLKRSNLDWVKAQRDIYELSAGEIVDLAIETMQENPSKLQGSKQRTDLPEEE